MFNCSSCGKTSPARVSPVIRVTERPQTYFNRNSEGEVITSHGTEIVTEEKLCTCAGAVERGDFTDLSSFVVLGLTMQAHARSCKKLLNDTEETKDGEKKIRPGCKICQQNLRTYLTIPALAAAKYLEEPSARVVKFSLGSIVLDNFIKRAEQSESFIGGFVEIRSKRAKADVLASAAILGQYEKMGGRI